MNKRFFWPAAGLLGVAGLIFAITYASAQRPGLGGTASAYAAPGRFAAVHATERMVFVLDTTTGQVYKVTEFKRGDELPRLADTAPKTERPPVREGERIPVRADRTPVRDRDPIPGRRDPVRDGLKETPRPVKPRPDILKGGKDSLPVPQTPSDIDKKAPRRTPSGLDR